MAANRSSSDLETWKMGQYLLFKQKCMHVVYLAITAITFSQPIDSTPSLSKDIIIVIIQDPLVAAALHDDGTHTETMMSYFYYDLG